MRRLHKTHSNASARNSSSGIHVIHSAALIMWNHVRFPCSWWPINDGSIMSSRLNGMDHKLCSITRHNTLVVNSKELWDTVNRIPNSWYPDPTISREQVVILCPWSILRLSKYVYQQVDYSCNLLQENSKGNINFIILIVWLLSTQKVLHYVNQSSQEEYNDYELEGWTVHTRPFIFGYMTRSIRFRSHHQKVLATLATIKVKCFRLLLNVDYMGVAAAHFRR